MCALVSELFKAKNSVNAHTQIRSVGVLCTTLHISAKSSN